MLKAIHALFIGSFIISIGINNFFLPYHILDGGIIGLALLLHYQWGFGVGLTIIITSIPIYFFAWKRYRYFFYNSIAGLVVSALFIDIFAFIKLDFLQFGPLSSAIIGGLLLGIGVGIMFRVDISTGGLDLFAQMLADSFRVNIGIMVFLVDLLVVASGIFVVTPTEILLSTIAVTATGFATMLMTLDNFSTASGHNFT
ncbi:YitT family protein [Bacillus sp. FJAT-45350]|uniref:YitT family protein n=1 Tax=Bacillus sp. FJAT-45350 TaxID=2011014 RepID=UPI000BB79596|nr:YitT family protein [Bacillus sp. FJAT-45350]